MTIKEFSNEFDVSLNSYSGSSIELDEYEKSVLLTEAQEMLVRELYKGVPQGESFEKTEETRRSLDSLIKTVRLDPTASQKGLSHSTMYELPQDLWFITYEAVLLNDNSAGCMNGKEIQVIPMTQDEWNRSSRNPFRKPTKRKSVRLDSGNLLVELISEFKLGTYIVRYLSKPNPIILLPLDGLTLNGYAGAKEDGTPTKIASEAIKGIECELNSVTHRAILERAVQLALSRVPQTGK